MPNEADRAGSELRLARHQALFASGIASLLIWFVWNWPQALTTQYVLLTIAWLASSGYFAARWAKLRRPGGGPAE